MRRRPITTYINFLRINGPNPLNGIKQSTITPSFTYNSVNHPITPTGGKSLSVSVQFAGSFLGGNVNQIEPVIDGKYFHRSPLNHKHVIGAARSGQVRDRLRRQGGASVQPLLHGRRERHSRIRHLEHQPGGVHADVGDGGSAEQRRHSAPAAHGGQRRNRPSSM